MFGTWQDFSDVNYKPGVTGTPTDAIQQAIDIASGIWDSIGSSLTVTSLMDGTHVAGSCHYSGNAVDLRTRDLSQGQQQQVYSQLQQQLPGYQVLWEADHIHVQYRPAGGCAGAIGGAGGGSPTIVDSSGGSIIDTGSADSSGFDLSSLLTDPASLLLIAFGLFFLLKGR